MSFSENLLTMIAVERQKIPQLCLESRSVFLRNLQCLLTVMQASELLLYLATRSLGDTLPAVRDYYVRHAEEEAGHAKWLQEDIGELHSATLPREAIALAGSAYYMVLHVSPVALLGYMAVLECFPMENSQVEFLESLHGKQLLRTIRIHADADKQHGADILTLLDGLPEQYQSCVQEMALITCQLLAELATSIIRDTSHE